MNVFLYIAKMKDGARTQLDLRKAQPQTSDIELMNTFTAAQLHPL